MIRKVFHISYKVGRRIVVAVVGATVLLLGVVMLVTPGPALVFIPVGLAILSIEFTWARFWLKKLRTTISNKNSRNFSRRAESRRENTSP